MHSYYQAGSPPITPTSAVPHRSPTTPNNIISPVRLTPAYNIQPTYVGRHASYDRHAAGPNPTTTVLPLREAPVGRSYAASRHGPPAPALQNIPTSRVHTAPVLQPAMNRAPVARSVRIEHLDPDFKKANVVKIFEHFGVIESCRTQSVKDNRGRVKSVTAYATYRGAVGASKAVGALNGQKVGDRRVLVCFDPRADRDYEPQQQNARMVVARNAGQAGSRHTCEE